MSIINIVAMDPSLRNWGFAKATIDTSDMSVVVNSIGMTNTSGMSKSVAKVVRKSSDDVARAKALFNGAMKSCEGAAIAMAEIPVGAQSSRAMMSVGVCTAILGSLQIPLIEVSPSEVKMASVGDKKATKKEMIEWATEKHPDVNWKTRMLKGNRVFTNDNEHMADAIAVIYAGMETEQFRAAMEMLRSFSLAA